MIAVYKSSIASECEYCAETCIDIVESLEEAREIAKTFLGQGCDAIVIEASHHDDHDYRPNGHVVQILGQEPSLEAEKDADYKHDAMMDEYWAANAGDDE